jgi:hypothetical protein
MAVSPANILSKRDWPAATARDIGAHMFRGRLPSFCRSSFRVTLLFFLDVLELSFDDPSDFSLSGFSPMTAMARLQTSFNSSSPILHSG